MLHYLKKWASSQPNTKFINKLTFRQAYDLACSYVRPLASITDTRVALLASNRQESLLVLFALLLLEKEVLLLNPALTKTEIAEQTRHLNISVVVHPETILTDFSPLLAKDIPKLNWEPAADKIAVLMNTSATSGKFKTVPITWGMISAQVKASAQVVGVQADDNWLCALPIFHVSGLSIVMRSLYNGTRLTLLSKFSEEQVLELVNSEKLTMMSLVPTQLKRLIEPLERHSLRMILLGGETIPLSLVEKSAAKNLPIFKTYGMTETFSQSATFNVLEAPEKIASAGKALPGVKIRIQQPDQNGIGEISLYSPMLIQGYLDMPLLNGYFMTGDVGWLDADDYLYVLNRRRDIIISGGENIYPKEIEDLLYRLPEISECAVIPRSDKSWGQIPVLYYAGNLTETEIQKYLSDKLAKFKQPKALIKLAELPKNPSGKILRKDLK
ncbi:o-succinylbenzoate--CoA ligase [Lactovum odontotermitis]